MKEISTLLLLIISISLHAQTVIFVNKNVSGGLQNGSSWAHAFPDLQQALMAAADGDEIWVAAATYYPTTTNDRSVSFVLKQGVRMYGGFAGTESAKHQRDFILNLTILSGNIGASYSGDNSYHVVYGSGVDSTTILDGFEVSRGNATGTFPHSRGGGLYLEPSPNLYNTCPVIQNCRFEYNFAVAGAAVYCSYDFGNVVNPVLLNCSFVHNRATTFAGALYKGGPALADRPFMVENCQFVKNAAFTSEGGGVFLTSTGNTSIFRKCLFEKDSAIASWGAGLYFAGYWSDSDGGKLVLDSCNFKGNHGSEGVGFCYTNFFQPGARFECDIINTNFENNKTTAGDGPAFFISGGIQGKVTVNIINSTFFNNRTATYGTTKIEAGLNSDIAIKIKNCRYLNNFNAAANHITNFLLLVGVSKDESKCRVAIDNCLFANNGGGIAVLSAEESDVQTNITNCTFYRNNRFVVDKSWYPGFGGSATHRNDCFITNCIFWEPGSAINQMFTNNDFTNVNMYDYFIDHTMVSLTDSIVPGGPEAFGDRVVFGKYPMFSDTAVGDFHLLPCSPAVNKGDNTAVDTVGLLTDLDGNARISRDTVDLGAYEVRDSCLTSTQHEPDAMASLHLSPNPAPASGDLLIRLNAGQDSGRLHWSVTDIQGRPVKRGETVVAGSFGISAPDLPGVYLLEIRGTGQPARLKFVVH